MGFDKRGTELEQQLVASLLLTDKERELLSRAFKDYIGKRNTAFETLLRTVRDEGTSEHAGQWTQALAGAQDAVKTLGEALNSVSPPSTSADILLKSTTSAESKFFTLLIDAKLGERQDALLRYHRDLTSLTSSLELKWKGLLEGDQAFDEKVKEAAQRIKDLYTEAARELVDTKTKLMETAAKLIAGGAAGPATAPIPSMKLEALRLLKELAKAGASWWLARYSKYSTEVATIKALAQSERAIVVMFKQFRKDTREFMDRNPLEKAVEAYDLARRDLEGAVAATLTSPQRDDSKELVDGILAQLSNYVAMVRKDHDAFLTAHKEKFWGPVGEPVKQDLLEGRFWEDMGSMLARSDLSAQLRTWRDETKRSITVDMGPMTEEERTEIRAIISQDLEQMLKAMSDVEGMLDRDLKNLFSREDAARELASD